MTFDDNTSIEACADHLWLTFSAAELAALTRRDDEWRAKRRASRASRGKLTTSDRFKQHIAEHNAAISVLARKPAPAGTVRTTQQISETLRLKSGRANHAIPVASALICPPADLPIDPYILGAWLGDGHNNQAAITCHDPEILDHIQTAGQCVTARSEVGAFGLPGGLLQELRKLHLLDHAKHIPQVYLRASVDQRIALLQGLMDTDGNATERGACEFTTTIPALRDGMGELLASLGIKAGGSEGRATLDGRDCGPKYRFKFLAPFPAFRLTRKAERQGKSVRRTTKFRYVEKCERINPVPMRCITVDSPNSLYLAGRQMVPTHNTDLLCGTALTQHTRSIIFRREYPQLRGVRDRIDELLGPGRRFSGKEQRYRLGDSRFLELGSVPNEEDKQRYQGRPHDLKGFDEVTHFTRSQYKFLIGWVRSESPSQRIRVIATGNPPTNAEGYWVIEYWAPWLDPQHPNPAQPGELRWFATVNGEDFEVDGPEPFQVQGEPELIRPRSRTFIRARVQDNPYYMASGYMSVLQGLPEPLRSQMLNGDFGAGREDNERQVIPTAWVLAAQGRWTEKPPYHRCDAIGVDIARGGNNKTVLTPRYGNWFGRQKVVPGSQTPDGWTGLQHIIAAIPSGQTPDINIDVIGVGSAVMDLVMGQGLKGIAMDARRSSHTKDRSGLMRFVNRRAEWWWNLREALDPLLGDDLAIPPDRELLADLTAPLWEPRSNGIIVESKDDIIERIGRSPDKGDSLVLAYNTVEAPFRTVII